MSNSGPSAKCRGCGNALGERFEVAEMMYRTGESFAYFRCGACQSISRIGTPDNLEKYYDNNLYYSFDSPVPDTPKALAVRKRIMRKRDAGELFGQMPNRMLSKWKPNPALADLKRYIACVKAPNPNMRVLDVGCGNGALVRRMRDASFNNVVGIDPFLADFNAIDGVLCQSQLGDYPEYDFDLIMMHHVLEHDDDPGQLLCAAKERLALGGVVLVRVPVVSQSTWGKFGPCWAELDPPRHAYLPTVSSLEQLGQSAGLHVHRVDYEAEPFTFAASQIASQGRAFANETHEDKFPDEAWHAFQNTALEFAMVGQAPRVAIHFCSHEAVATIPRLAVPTFDPIDVPAVPIKEPIQ
jgi:SAM-dependent methyltransferase